MSSIPLSTRLASAAVVFFGRYGEVTRLAQDRGTSRQTLYRQAHAVAQALEATQDPDRLRSLQQCLAQAQARQADLQQQLAHAIVLDDDKLAQFASTAQATGVPLSAARALLGVLTPRPPAVASLGRLSRRAARRASAALAVLDQYSRPRARQVAADEIFVGRQPVLMTVEQDSLCWLGARLAASRDGPQWVREFRNLPAAEQVTRDGGQGLAKGLALVNQERQAAGQPPLDDQEDHFHILQRGQRALREVQGQATRALNAAAQLQQRIDRNRKAGVPLAGGTVAAVNQRWHQAEVAYQRWSGQDDAWKRLRAALRLFRPDGALNTRAQAEAEVRAALAELTGPEWKRIQTKLVGPEAFTFLDRVEREVRALPGAPEVLQAALRIEGLRRHGEAWRGDGPSARALRGVLLAAGLVLALAQGAGERALSAVRGVLRGVWRASSLVEGLNSVLRMQQARQKRLTPELLNLKRLYWNLHEFRAGRRKGESPYARLGVKVPPGSWWELLKIPPEQLRQQLSALNPPP